MTILNSFQHMTNLGESIFSTGLLFGLIVIVCTIVAWYYM